ncbi:MAG TPA: hypothetical protein VGK23_05975 [Methanomassiliicoccales archaeon]|jgi:hypothetical protein
MVTFMITGTSDPAVVEVQMNYFVISNTVQNSSLYLPDPSPEHYDGRLSGNTLWISQSGDVKGTFTFYETTMTGTWDDLDRGNYILQECYTYPDALVLHKHTVVS